MPEPSLLPTRGFRLALPRWQRWARATLNGLVGAVFIWFVLSPEVESWLRVLALIGLGATGAALWSLLGPVVEVRPGALRIQQVWPRRRDVAWGDLAVVAVAPDRWVLELELRSGDRLTLPAVEDLDGLYSLVERHRSAGEA